jgi:DNA polymerase/3'-5' exonuclease PolX
MADAEFLMYWLKPHCERIWIAGSLRRHKSTVGDIELLIIPKIEAGIVDRADAAIRSAISEGMLGYRLNARGSHTYGAQNKLLVYKHTGIGVDIFSTDQERWPVALVVRTGGAETNKMIATAAIRKGWRFNAYGSGFTKGDGTKVVCLTEREVFEAVDLEYLAPEARR